MKQEQETVQTNQREILGMNMAQREKTIGGFGVTGPLPTKAGRRERYITEAGWRLMTQKGQHLYNGSSGR